MTLTRILQTFTLQQISLACAHPVASMFIGEACRLKLMIMDEKKSKDVIFAQSCKKDNHIAHRSIDNFECACLPLKKYVSVVKLRCQLFSNSVLEIKKEKNGTISEEILPKLRHLSSMGILLWLSVF